MQHRYFAICTAAILAFTQGQPTTQAEILTYGFSGVITSHDNYTDLPVEEAFPVGTPWRFIYTFESTVPLVENTEYPDLDRARFNADKETSGRTFIATFTLGDQTYAQLSGEFGRSGAFGLKDNYQFNNESDPKDYYVVEGHQFPDIDGVGAYNVAVVLRGNQGAHEGVDLGMQPDIDNYQVVRFLIWSPDYIDGLEIGYGAHGNIDDFFVVPEPGMVLLLTIATLSSINRRRY